MKAIIYEGANTISISEKEIPEIREGWALIKTSHVGICGTDLNIYAGAHPRATAPLIMGHEFSGYIVAGHPTLQEGTRVTVNPLLTCGTCTPCVTGQSHVCETLKLVGIDCDGAMAEFVLAPIDRILPLSANLSSKLAALMEPVAVAVHAARQGSYIPGDSVVVFGGGTIGLCVAMTLKSYGASNIMIVEPNQLRIKKIEELGFKTINPFTENVKDMIMKNTHGVGADFVIDCAGHPSVVPQLTETVKVRGKIIIVAAYKKPPEVNLLQGMFKELNISFVRVYTEKDFQLAQDLLEKEPVFEKIITHVLSVEEAQNGFDLLTSASDAIKVMYRFD